MLGSGAVTVIAEGTDLLAAGTNVLRFFRNESCGKCVPCRVGSHKAHEMLTEALSSGNGPADLNDRLTELEATLRLTSICGLGQVALGPVMSVFGMERGATEARPHPRPERPPDRPPAPEPMPARTQREFFAVRTLHEALTRFRPGRRTGTEGVGLEAALGRVPFVRRGAARAARLRARDRRRLRGASRRHLRRLRGPSLVPRAGRGGPHGQAAGGGRASGHRRSDRDGGPAAAGSRRRPNGRAHSVGGARAVGGAAAGGARGRDGASRRGRRAGRRARRVRAALARPGPGDAGGRRCHGGRRFRAAARDRRLDRRRARPAGHARARDRPGARLDRGGAGRHGSRRGRPATPRRDRARRSRRAGRHASRRARRERRARRLRRVVGGRARRDGRGDRLARRAGHLVPRARVSPGQADAARRVRRRSGDRSAGQSPLCLGRVPGARRAARAARGRLHRPAARADRARPPRPRPAIGRRPRRRCPGPRARRRRNPALRIVVAALDPHRRRRLSGVPEAATALAAGCDVEVTLYRYRRYLG